MAQDIFSWAFSDPCSKWPLYLFVIVFLLSCFLGAMAYEDANKAWIPGGVAGLVIAIYGSYHFKTLMALREQVENYEKLNKEMKKANCALKGEIHRLGQAKDDLSKSGSSLKETNQKNADNLVKFQSGLSKIAQIAKEMKTKWENKLVERKRDTYMKVFDEMEFKNDEEGMTKNEYDTFLKALPAAYRASLQRADTFNTLAGKDGMVDFEEFKGLLDKIEIDLKEIPEREEEENKQDAQQGNSNQVPNEVAKTRSQNDVDEEQEYSPLLEKENEDKPANTEKDKNDKPDS